jgi:hypothetical protein
VASFASLRTALEKLRAELDAQRPAGVVIERYRYPDANSFEAAVAEAERQVGPYGLVVVIRDIASEPETGPEPIPPNVDSVGR